MKKVVKIMAGLLLGLVIAASVKTEAKAGQNYSLDTLYGYLYGFEQDGGSTFLVGYNANAASQYAQDLSNAYQSIYQAMYMQKLAEQYYSYIQQATYLANWIQPYVMLTGGTNPYIEYYNNAVAQYEYLMNFYYR